MNAEGEEWREHGVDYDAGSDVIGAGASFWRCLTGDPQCTQSLLLLVVRGGGGGGRGGLDSTWLD